jgi:predicted membrane channel-forming protein YqfA (hemolysin III family)
MIQNSCGVWTVLITASVVSTLKERERDSYLGERFISVGWIVGLYGVSYISLDVKISFF